MGNEDFRRELNRAFDQIAGAPSADLSDRVRKAVANGSEPRTPYWLAAAAAAAIAILLVGVLFVSNPLRRTTGPAGFGPTPTPSASPSVTPTSSPEPAFACVAQDLPAQGAPPPVAYISGLRTGTHGTYDRITIEFANGTPGEVQITAPGGTTFTLSPSGQSVTVKGDHGLLVTIHGADLHTSYTGPIDIVTGYGTLVEVRRVQDFEGVVQLALGVKGSGCYRAFYLNNPDRLVIDVQAAS